MAGQPSVSLPFIPPLWEDVGLRKVAAEDANLQWKKTRVKRIRKVRV